MYEGLSKILWGIFIATFNINLGPIKILPAFVGFMVIASGINTIYNEHHIDEFKKYNDHFGHLEGDACLKNVAMTLLRASPSSFNAASTSASIRMLRRRSSTPPSQQCAATWTRSRRPARNHSR